MGNIKFTAFGLTVKKKMLDLGMKQCELQTMVSERTGLFVDAGYMYKILTGERSAPKIVAEICNILEIDETKKQERT